jgi:hypothetical protein
MQKSKIIEALRPVITVFEELGISYYIGGSIASSAYGTPRSTMDVDLITALSFIHIEPLKKKLEGEYLVDEEMIKDALNTKTSFNIIHYKSMLKVDIFILKEQLYSHKAFERRTQDSLQDESETLNIFLCSPEDVILTKLEWYRLGGETSERQWLDILGVIKVQGNSLDKNYLIEWAKKLDVFDLLAKSFSESKEELN